MMSRRFLLTGAAALAAGAALPALAQDRISVDLLDRSAVSADDLEDGLRDLGVFPADPAGGAAPAQPAPPPGTEVSLQLSVPFNINSASLRPDAREIVLVIADFLRRDAVKARSFIVEGHTDLSGPYDYNMSLSWQRAQTVVAVLTGLGIDPLRLRAAGYGPQRLLPAQDPYSARHRRVELVTVV